MIPGNARVLKCPKCGKKKEVMTLISMHIYESTLWSDSKQDLGKMTPQVSPIQRCPRCGAFYFANRQPWKFGKDCSFEQGRLSYEELKAAVAQFDADGDMTDDEKLTLLLMTVWGYNDVFTRDTLLGEIQRTEREMDCWVKGCGEPVAEALRTGDYDKLHMEYDGKYDGVAKHIRELYDKRDKLNEQREQWLTAETPAEDQAFFKSVVERLLALNDVDGVLRAELLREIGRYDDALQLLDDYATENEFLRSLKEQVRMSAERRETKPFIVKTED